MEIPNYGAGGRGASIYIYLNSKGLADWFNWTLGSPAVLLSGPGGRQESGGQFKLKVAPKIPQWRLLSVSIPFTEVSPNCFTTLLNFQRGEKRAYKAAASGFYSGKGEEGEAELQVKGREAQRSST